MDEFMQSLGYNLLLVALGAVGGYFYFQKKTGVALLLLGLVAAALLMGRDTVLSARTDIQALVDPSRSCPDGDQLPLAKSDTEVAFDKTEHTAWVNTNGDQWSRPIRYNGASASFIRNLSLSICVRIERADGSNYVVVRRPSHETTGPPARLDGGVRVRFASLKGGAPQQIGVRLD